MTDIDNEIRRALSAEDEAFARQFEEQGLIGQFKSAFQGKMGWVSTASLIFGTLVQIVFFYAAWKFFTVDDMTLKVNFGAIAWFTAIMVAFMKVWFWMRMESNRVMREVKRVELQLARLQMRGEESNSASK